MTPKLALFLKEYRAEIESIYWQLGKPLILDGLVFASVVSHKWPYNEQVYRG
jgi:hypothetical protein